MRTLFIIDLINELIKSGEFQALLGGYRRGEFPLKVEGAEGAFRHLLTAGLFGLQESPALMVFPRNRELRESLLDFQAAEIPLGILPDWDIIPYSGQRGPLFKAGERLQTLTRLLTGEKLLVLASLRTFLSPVVNPEWLREKLFAIRPGQELDPAAIGDRLSRYGYLRVPLVQGPGEFALRGEVLDLFAPGAPEAVRVVFEFDRVEEIKTFGPESQASREKIQEIYLSPCREILWEEPRIRGLEAFLKGRGVKGGESLIDALWETGSCPHEEFLFPLSFERPSFLGDYLGRDSLVFFAGWERLTSQGESLRREYRDLYYRSAGNLPKPEFLLREPEEGLELPRRGVRFYEIRGGGSFAFTVEGPRSFFGNITYLKE
ncbi:MAG: hypothetical protein LBQ61_03270, partial [Spirochaetales bacterium]|nr:hypothetical protein [Spirochaetales bacterium]